MGLPIYVIDAFTGKPFGGNPAAVCLLDAPRPDEWLQGVAGEMNHTATAYLLPQDDGYKVRWFTATAELALCGHGTLASAHLLWETGRVPASQPIRFYSPGGLLTARRAGETIVLDFPATPITENSTPDGLLEALDGVQSRFTGQNQFDYLVEVESEAAVRGLQPDLAALKRLPVRGVIVTSRATAPNYDFVSRFFAPSVGINEDSATGSAHTTLGPYWQTRLGKNSFVAYQASARGGRLSVTVEGERVFIGGEAVTIWRGELLV